MKSHTLPALLLTLLSMLACSGGVMSKENDPSVYFNEPQVVSLCKAAMAGNIAAIDQLVNEGVNVNASGKGGMTPLLYSFVGFNKPGLQRLMEHGADPNQQRDHKSSFMSYAAQTIDSDYLEMALAHGGDPNLKGRMFYTPLFEAAMENNAGVERRLKLLLDHGADINAISKGILDNAAMAAARINQYDSALYLLQLGIDYERQNKAGYTIVHSLEKNNIGYNPGYEGYDARTRVAQFLIEKGIEVQLKEPYEAPRGWLEASFRAIGKPVPPHLK